MNACAASRASYQSTGVFCAARAALTRFMQYDDVFLDAPCEVVGRVTICLQIAGQTIPQVGARLDQFDVSLVLTPDE